MFLRPPDHGAEGKKNLLKRFGVVSNAGYNKLTGHYSNALHFLARRKWIVLGGVALFTAALYILMQTTPSSFVPEEDMGTIFVNIQLFRPPPPPWNAWKP